MVLKMISYADKIEQTHTCLAGLDFHVLIMYGVIQNCKQIFRIYSIFFFFPQSGCKVIF